MYGKRTTLQMEKVQILYEFLYQLPKADISLSETHLTCLHCAFQPFVADRFGFTGHLPTCLTALLLFPAAGSARCQLPSTKQQTDRVGNELVKYLASLRYLFYFLKFCHFLVCTQTRSGQNTVCTRNIADSLYPRTQKVHTFLEKNDEEQLFFPFNQPCVFGLLQQ